MRRDIVNSCFIMDWVCLLKILSKGDAIRMDVGVVYVCLKPGKSFYKSNLITTYKQLISLQNILFPTPTIITNTSN